MNWSPFSVRESTKDPIPMYDPLIQRIRISLYRLTVVRLKLHCEPTKTHQNVFVISSTKLSRF